LKSPAHSFFQLSPARHVIVAWSQDAPATQLAFGPEHGAPTAALGVQVPSRQYASATHVAFEQGPPTSTGTVQVPFWHQLPAAESHA
jgi:hypothetical protein